MNQQQSTSITTTAQVLSNFRKRIRNQNREPRYPVIKIETELGIEVRCRNCKEYWPHDDYFFYRTTKGGLRTTCKDCANESRRKKK